MSEQEPLPDAADNTPEALPVITSDSPPQNLSLILSIFMMALPFAFLIVVFGYFSAATERFTESRNIEIVLHQAAISGFIAVGITAVILLAKLDLSALGLVALTGYIFVDIANEEAVTSAIVTVLVISLVIGVIQGILIGGLQMRGTLLTLATGAIASSLVLNISDGRPIPLRVDPPGFFSETTSSSIPVMLVALIGIVIVLDALHFGLKTSLAKDPPTMPAWLMGLLVVGAAYVFSALMTGFGGILLVSRVRVADPSLGSGVSLLLPALAAIVIGGTSPYGKYGWFIGTVVGMIGIAALTNGLVLEGAAFYMRDLILGILLAVWLVLHGVVKLILDYNQPKPVET